MRAALGFQARTGWAALVALARKAAFRIMLESTDALTDEHFEIVRRKRSEAVEIVRREVSRALADSPSSDLDPTIVTFAVNGMANWLFFWFDPDGRLSVEEVADQLERLLFEGIPPAEE